MAAVTHDNPPDGIQFALAQPNALQTIVKYTLVFWALCVIAGAAVAIAMINADMKPQLAFWYGVTIMLLPIVAVVIVAILLWVIVALIS